MGKRKSLTGVIHHTQSTDDATFGALDDAGYCLGEGQFEGLSSIHSDVATLPAGYITGDDNNFYRIFDEDFYEFIGEIDCDDVEGLGVCFETPITPWGKNRWAYNISKVESS